MQRVWYQHNREAVIAALQRGERPDLATTMACGPVDELVALHAASPAPTEMLHFAPRTRSPERWPRPSRARLTADR
jgi:hypothetical protein